MPLHVLFPEAEADEAAGAAEAARAGAGAGAGADDRGGLGAVSEDLFGGPSTRDERSQSWQVSGGGVRDGAQRFRDLKKLLQRFQGRHCWHNFCPGVLPHDAVARSPKLLRFKHRSLARYGGRRFVVLSLHGSAFLRGMCEGLVGLAVAVFRGWLPGSAIEDSLRPDLVRLVHG